MTLTRIALALGCAATLAACVGPDAGSSPARSSSGIGGTVESPVRAEAYRLVGLRVAIPDNLRVSEANAFYPIADIVWRGEPVGDRRAQIRAMFADGAAQAMAGVEEGVPAVAEVEITRFHALTERTRYTIGGVHSIKFLLTLRDPETDAILDGPRLIDADVKAAGGNRAIAEDVAGRTQRVVIVEDLAQMFRRELGLPAATASVPAVAGQPVFTAVDITAD